MAATRTDEGAPLAYDNLFRPPQIAGCPLRASRCRPVPYPPATVDASRERMFEAGVQFVPAVAVRGVTPTAIDLVALATGRSQSPPADTVVIVSYHQPNDDISAYLSAGPWTLHRVGSVTGTDSILSAVHSATAVARAI